MHVKFFKNLNCRFLKPSSAALFRSHRDLRPVLPTIDHVSYITRRYFRGFYIGS